MTKYLGLSVLILAVFGLLSLGCEVPSSRPGARTSSRSDSSSLPRFSSELTQKAKEKKVGDSVLKYEDLKEGEGKEAKAGDTVEVHYTGWLTNGKMFDSSLRHNEPFRFKLGAGEVIKGWDEGVAGMKVGGKRKLIIPPELGYGKRGAGRDIPPDSTLVFDVELLQIK